MRSPAAPTVLLVPAVLALVLSGCAGLLHSDAKPDQVYFLRVAPPPAGEGARPAVEASVRVSHPLAAPGLDSPRIVLLQSDRRMSFYAGSRWPSPAPDVIEALVVETLRASGSWTSVEDATSPFPSDYLLQIVVRRFDAEYQSGVPAPEVRVAFDCMLGTRAGRDVIASFSAEGSSAAAANRLSDVVAAFESAMNAALASLSERAAEAARKAQKHPSTVNR